MPVIGIGVKLDCNSKLRPTKGASNGDAGSWTLIAAFRYEARLQRSGNRSEQGHHKAHCCHVAARFRGGRRGAASVT